MIAIDPNVFIGTVIIAVTEAIRYVAPKVRGALTIVAAAAVGLLVALIDVQIGVADLSPAQGILIGLSAAGVVTVATRLSTPGGNTPPQN